MVDNAPAPLGTTLRAVITENRWPELLIVRGEDGVERAPFGTCFDPTWQVGEVGTLTYQECGRAGAMWTFRREAVEEG